MLDFLKNIFRTTDFSIKTSAIKFLVSLVRKIELLGASVTQSSEQAPFTLRTCVRFRRGFIITLY
jgi:hypothetical protein